MRCLIYLITITLIFIASVFEVVKNGSYSFLYSFSLIPVVVACLFSRRIEAIILVVISSLLAASFILLGVNHVFVMQTTILLLLGGALSYYFRWMTENALTDKAKVLEAANEEHRLTNEQNDTTQANKKELEKAVYDISSLYQAPKKMADSTTLEELAESLLQTAEQYFSFTKCRLLVFSFKSKEPKIDVVYDVPKQENDEEKTGGYEEQLINVIGNKKTPLIIDRAAGMSPPKGLSLPASTETFLAVPLNVGNRYNGIFVIEDFKLDDLVRFMILANQFSMVLERIRLFELVHELAITDGLTTVFVRRHFLKRLAEEIERAKYFNTRLSFVMVDIDFFKRCNDKYGHLVGDVVLKEVAAILKDSLRDIDIIGRYGGEEFSIMLPETSKEGAGIVAERLRKAVESATIRAYDETVNITISLGVGTFPDDTDELNQLIDKSDQMLYKAKKTGRNRLEVFGS